MELALVVRYTHYSFMIVGFNRIPIVSWLRSQASESITHAQEAGEIITQFGGYPSLGIGPLLDTRRNNLTDILTEAIEGERAGLALYEQLHGQVEGKSIFLEEYARKMLAEEEKHVSEVDKMLRAPGEPSKR